MIQLPMEDFPHRSRQTPQYSHAFQSAEVQLALFIKVQNTKAKRKVLHGKNDNKNLLYDFTVRFILDTWWSWVHESSKQKTQFSSWKDLNDYSL